MIGSTNSTNPHIERQIKVSRKTITLVVMFAAFSSVAAATFNAKTASDNGSQAIRLAASDSQAVTAVDTIQSALLCRQLHKHIEKFQRDRNRLCPTDQLLVRGSILERSGCNIE